MDVCFFGCVFFSVRTRKTSGMFFRLADLEGAFLRGLGCFFGWGLGERRRFFSVGARVCFSGPRIRGGIFRLSSGNRMFFSRCPRGTSGVLGFKMTMNSI